MRGFTPRQRLILALMATAVVAVFGLFGYVVVTTTRQMAALSPLPSPQPPVSPLGSPSAAAEAPSPGASTSPTAEPTTAPTPTRAVPLSQIQSARAVHEVARILARVRDLPPVEQFPVSFPSEREIALYLLQRYGDIRPQEALVLYGLLGLVPRLESLPLPDVTAQAARVFSLYAPAGRQILLAAGRGPATPDDELALVHTLAHALQDTAFGLGEGAEPPRVPLAAACRPTTDAALALRALVEGDAVLTTAHYAGVAADPQEVDRLAGLAAGAEEPTYAPLSNIATFETIRLFPYRDGARFVAALYADGGWNAVNRAYAAPPCSTQEILHPERYRDRRPPLEPAVPDLAPVLGKGLGPRALRPEGWSLARRDTVGEFLIGLHLAAYLDDDGAARRAADGWAGDTFTLWTDETGREVIVWRLAWESREEAVEFERAYALLVPRFRTPPLVATPPPLGLTGRFWSGPAGAAYLSRTGRVVTVVWGPDLETLASVVPALP
ncbi:MAG: hypothetical protein ACP5ME_03975 [Anaerolineae bacterium]